MERSPRGAVRRGLAAPRPGPLGALHGRDRRRAPVRGRFGVGRLAQLRLPQGAIEAILLTHFHSDHIDGLGELLLQRWVNRAAREPVPIFGPEGVEPVVEGFAQAYRADRGYRVAHHGEAVVPPSGAGGVARAFRAPADGQAEVLIDDGGLRIAAFRVAHAPIEPAVGYVVPPLPIAPLEGVFLEGVDAVYPGPVALGRDGTAVHLPAGSDAIELEQLL